MAGDVVRHRLSFAIRFMDHFSGAPVPDELPVRLDGSYLRPVARRGAIQRRQQDGAYRFISVPTGAHRILWRDPFRRSQAGWARWAATDPEVMAPLPDPFVPVEVDLWPIASAEAPAAATGIRGKLTGAGVADLTIRIALQGAPFDRYTRSDAGGEFLFLPPGTLPPDPLTGRVPFQIAVEDAAGVSRAVTGGSFVPDTAGAPFAGPNFTVAPQSVLRILFSLA